MELVRNCDILDKNKCGQKPDIELIGGEFLYHALRDHAITFAIDPIIRSLEAKKTVNWW